MLHPASVRATFLAGFESEAVKLVVPDLHRFSQAHPCWRFKHHTIVKHDNCKVHWHENEVIGGGAGFVWQAE